MRDHADETGLPAVLLCCDSADEAHRIASRLKGAPFRVVPVARADAVRAADVERPGVVVVDATGDEAAALDLCRGLKDTPVVALLSPARPGAVTRAREAGAAETITAPIADAEFAIRMRAVHRLGRLRDAGHRTIPHYKEDA